jgi:hypothetical protein
VSPDHGLCDGGDPFALGVGDLPSVAADEEIEQFRTRLAREARVRLQVAPAQWFPVEDAAFPEVQVPCPEVQGDEGEFPPFQFLDEVVDLGVGGFGRGPGPPPMEQLIAVQYASGASFTSPSVALSRRLLRQTLKLNLLSITEERL